MSRTLASAPPVAAPVVVRIEVTIGSDGCSIAWSAPSIAVAIWAIGPEDPIDAYWYADGATQHVSTDEGEVLTVVTDAFEEDVPMCVGVSVVAATA